MTSKRQQIIDLINDYIYTNGRQRITAVQLNDILTLIANSFELVGAGTGGGINQVLNTDPNVDDNQKIINKNGGRLDLSGMIKVTDEISAPYMGIFTGVEGRKPDPKNPNRGYQFGAVTSNQIATVIGNSIGINPFEYLDEQKDLSSLSEFLNRERGNQKEEYKTAHRSALSEETKSIPTVEDRNRIDPELVGALSIYLPDNLSFGEKDVLKRGVYSGLVHEYTQNIIQIQEHRIKLGIARDYSYNGLPSRGVIGGESDTELELGDGYIEQSISYEGSDMSAYESLYAGAKEFSFNWNRTLSIDFDGLRFDSRKRLAYNTDSFSGTAGVATLVSGSILVNTTAMRANSHVMLTVQNSGEFQGNIRVSEKIPGSGFRISSTENTDNCEVLWQIIDLNY